MKGLTFVTKVKLVPTQKGHAVPVMKLIAKNLASILQWVFLIDAMVLLTLSQFNEIKPTGILVAAFFLTASTFTSNTTIYVNNLKALPRPKTFVSFLFCHFD